VPELASRRHIEALWPVCREALGQRPLEALSALAVCIGPGLIGSLLVGTCFAKAVAFAKGLPLVGVNHLEGHIFSAFLEGESPRFPFLALVVSGGHTSLYRVEGFLKYTELGRTRDDAAGEAYDKVAKLLGLGYPGGPAIDALARKAKPTIAFPRAYVPGSLDFSFSGLKTAVLKYLKDKRKPYSKRLVAQVASSFQEAVVDVLVRKTEWAIRKTGIRTLVVAGGVAANSALKERMGQMAQRRQVRLLVPSPRYCTDNAAMIALAGLYHLRAGRLAPMELSPKATLPL